MPGSSEIKNQITALGYSLLQADIIIKHLSNKIRIKWGEALDLFRLVHPEMLKRQFDHADITSLFSLVRGGYAKLNVVKTYINGNILDDVLGENVEDKLTNEQFIKILKADGGPENLDAMIKFLADPEKIRVIQEHGLTIDDIVNIVRRNNGHSNLDCFMALLDDSEFNQYLGTGMHCSITIQQLFLVANQESSHQNLKALSDFLKDSTKRIYIEDDILTMDDVIQILKQHGGWKNFEELDKFLSNNDLEKHVGDGPEKVSYKLLIKAAGRNGGNKTLAAISDFILSDTKRHIEDGTITVLNLFEIATAAGGGSLRIGALKAYLTKPEYLGLINPDNAIAILKKPEGHKSLDACLDFFDNLFTGKYIGFGQEKVSPLELTTMAKKEHGHRYINALSDYLLNKENYPGISFNVALKNLSKPKGYEKFETTARRELAESVSRKRKRNERDRFFSPERKIEAEGTAAAGLLSLSTGQS